MLNKIFKREAAANSDDKIFSIRWRIVFWMCTTVVTMLFLVGTIIYKKVVKIDEENYDAKVESILAVFDAAIDTYFTDIISTTKILTDVELIREDNDGITSYVDKTDPSGKIPMNPENFGSYEKSVYNLCKAFTEKKDCIQGISVALESNGSFVRFPEEPRSNNYDSRKRSWYKNAKAKNGEVNISDAYVASAGYKAIVCSVYFNDENNNPRGCISVDANVDYLSQLLEVTRKENTIEYEQYILLDKNGNIIVNQVDPSAEFINIKDLGLPEFENYKHGDDTWFTQQINGVAYEFWTWPTKSKYFEGDYIAVIPTSLVYKSDHEVLKTVFIVILISIICATLVSLVLGNNIVSPLEHTAKLLKNISEGEGDLTNRLPIQNNNELTLVSKYFNKTIEKVQETVKTVIKESIIMDEGAQDLSANMAETASAINQISSNISSIKGEILNQSAGVEETSATIKQISDNISKLTGNIDLQANSVSQSSSAIEEMVANIRSVTDILDKNEKSVAELATSAEKGRSVVNKTVELTEKISQDSEGLLEASTVIQNIASQTNLLAMNAAIEAAHAGEVGKGFSVVADEIRKLAEDSSKQGKRITEALHELKNTIESVSNASKDIQSQFNVIFDNTQRVTQQESVIKSAMDEQNAGSQQILNAMQEINSITQDVKSGAYVMEQGGKEIAIEMEKLAQVTSEISGSMNEMSLGVSEINNAMQNINNKTIENTDSIKRVSLEINKFKVE